MIDELVYQYKGTFNYFDFMMTMAPLVVDNLIFPIGEISDDSEPMFVEDSADYIPEIEDMFMRMGIEKMDGKSGFRFEKDMTYIQCIVSYDGKFGTEYGTFYVDVHGAIIIEPAEEEA